MPLADELKPGDALVVRGLGLGVLKSVKADVWTIRLGAADDLAEVRREKLEALVRRPVGTDEAAEILRLLSRADGEPDGRPWGEQYLALQRTRKAGTPLEQAGVLQRLFRLRHPDAAQLRAIDSFEDLLLPELAQVLKQKLGALRSRLHQGQPAFGYQAPDRDDDAPIAVLERSPRGWAPLGAFRVFSGPMAIGEYPVSEADERVFGDARATVVAPCEDGECFALSQDDGEDGLRYLVATREAVGRAEQLLASLEPLGSVVVEGASVHVLDEEIRDDRRYQTELENGEQPLGRGFIAGLGGDGAAPISGVRSSPGGPFCLFLVRT